MYIVKLSFDMLASHFRKFVLSVFIMAVSLTLLMFAVMIYAEGNYSYISCDKTLSSGVEGTAIIRIDWEEYDDAKIFIQKAYDREEISAVGSVIRHGLRTGIFDRMLEIQRGHAINQDYTKRK
ncbi:MAG: hypothetical protein ACI4EN_09560, partial [Butyrivibrio sp.]